jgi:NADPH:quinone reductase-like Zn-dependent oxidoreductase
MNATTGPSGQAATYAGDQTDMLNLKETGWLSAGNGEMLVRVHAAGLDRGTPDGGPAVPDLASFRLAGTKNPVPGFDVAGTVVAAGAGVTGFGAIEDVFGISRGSLAKYGCARQDKLVRKPANLIFAQAAVVAVSGLTTLQGPRDAGRLQPGQHVLITGASGAVGTFAVQIAKSFGAQVTDVCSAAKTDLVVSIGADHVLDYTRDDFADGRQRYDLILDIAGNSPLARLRRTNPGRDAGHRRRGRRRPLDRQDLPAAPGPDAMRDLQAGHARGKLIITVTEGFADDRARAHRGLKTP